ncbi:MAG: hypothetical protein AAFX44_00715 [Pseudomonadota bacterium]
MYNLKHLMSVAMAGVRDMRPALERALNDNPSDDRLNLVFGDGPRRRIAALIVGAIIVGELLRAFGPDVLLGSDFNLMSDINWAAIIIAVVYAVVIRRYLFQSGHAGEEDFPWLAGSIIPAAIALMLLSFVKSIVAGDLMSEDAEPGFMAIGKLVFEIADAYGAAAALTIALAALCYSQRWLTAIKDLAINLFVFKLLLEITVLIVIEIGIVGRILAAMVDGIFGIRLPGWVGDFVDFFSYALLLVTVYTAIIGATWVVCRQQFSALLTTGDVRVVAAVRDMAKKPKKPKKKKPKKPKRRWFGRRSRDDTADENQS